MINRVDITRFAEKQLSRLPRHIVERLLVWVKDVQARGIDEVRKTPGYHDEPLTGARLGQRSIRLNRSYRAIYTIDRNDILHFIQVEEVSKHDY
jgi:toxin HigB-1